MRPIVVVGSINMDLVSTATRIPIAGETLLGSSFQMHPGGKGANQAVAVARLGYPVELIGNLGSDLFGERLRAHLASAGVGLTGVKTAHGPTGIAAITVGSTGENCIVVTPGANAAVSPEHIEQHRSILGEAGMVLAQLEIPVESVERLAELCTHYEVPLMLDPAPACMLPASLLKRIRWFTPNETEADFYTHCGVRHLDAEGLRNTAHTLLAQGVAGVILKLGSRGTYLAAEGIERHLPARAVEAVDATAAGDAFNGAFAVARMLGKSALDSARFAVTAASISVTRAGAQSSMPTMEEVVGRLVT